jgi:SAM-dependent methyltransferase
MSDSSNADETYNDGERMMPVPTYGDEELIRHYSSHKFFRNIIEKDAEKLGLKNLEILDLGFGTGYASYIYSRSKVIAQIAAIDVTDDGLQWARENFHNDKIKYELIDAESFLSRKNKHDYIVTRHVLEHIEDGLNVVKEDKYTKRLCVNVPYNEKAGNPFHLIVGITEKAFPKYHNVEFFYEDLEGNTYDTKPKGVYINSIIYIASKEGMPPVSSYVKFPIKSANMDEIIDELADSNSNYSKSAIKIMLERYNNRAKSESLALSRINELEIMASERNDLMAQLDLVKKELKAIKGSKKWKYAQRAGEAKNKLLGK